MGGTMSIGSNWETRAKANRAQLAKSEAESKLDESKRRREEIATEFLRLKEDHEWLHRIAAEAAEYGDMEWHYLLKRNNGMPFVVYKGDEQYFEGALDQLRRHCATQDIKCTYKRSDDGEIVLILSVLD